MSIGEEDIISPADCSLCFGVPMNKSEYLDAADINKFDWVPTRCNQISELYNISYEQAVEKDWKSYVGSGVCGILNSLADVAERQRVNVRRNATFKDLKTSLENSKVTILIAHWCNTPFISEDVLDADQIIIYANYGSGWTSKEVKYSLKRFKKYANNDEREWVEKSLSFLVDRTIKKREKALSKPNNFFSLFDNSPDIGRPWLEYVLGSKLRHSKPLELRDDMYSAESVWSLIPEDKHRVFDLSSCNATELSQIISVERRLCRTIAPFHSIYPQLAAHLIGKTINNLNGLSYLNARIKALDEIKNLYDIKGLTERKD